MMRAKGIALRCMTIASACVLTAGGLLLQAENPAAAARASAAKGSPLLMDAFNPFSGPTATYGVYEFSGCPPAAYEVNQAGGILGHPLKCGTVDTRGDPADAVLAAHKMLATSSNLVGILGPSSDEDLATVPIFNTAKVPMMDNGGTVGLCSGSKTYPYFWRTIPSDNISGYALALWGKVKGYKKAAAVFQNDVASQGNVPGLVKGYKELGFKLVVNLSIPPTETSYETEVQRVISAHPQAIFTEMSPQTAGTFFSELKQAGGLVPLVGAAGVTGPEFLKALTTAIGAQDVAKYFRIVTPGAETAGAAFNAWKQALLKAPGEYKNPQQFLNSSYSEAPFDDAIIMALAMVAAHSVKPAVYDKHITTVTEARSGAVVVHTYAAGVAALKAGKRIQYVGVTGVVAFTKHHCSPGIFDTTQELPQTKTKVTAVLPTGKLTKLVDG
jgi:ABC-type branched-subunit amino acid transport system substrate-binding protein